MPPRPAWSLEPALWNDHDIARPHFYVGGDISSLDQVLEADAIEFAAVRDPKDARGIAVGKVRESTNRNHHIEQCHVFSIRQNLRLSRLADDPDLLASRTDEARHNHGHHRVADVLDQRLFHVTFKLGGCLAQRLKIVYQWRGELAIGSHGHAHRKLRIA